VEGTAIIAREKNSELAGLDGALLERCQGFLHDPPEGGRATGLGDLAEAAGVGLEVDEAAIPVLPETRTLCARLGLDPLGLIASGALLLAVAPGDAAAILAALDEAGIAAAHIGRVVEREQGILLLAGASLRPRARPLPRFERDEVARLFE